MIKEIEIPDGYEARIKGNKVILEPKDSEDERIKNCIEELLRKAPQSYFVDTGTTFVECFTYLKKQKEQTPVTIVRIPKFRVGDIIQRVPLEKWDRSKKITSIDEHGYNFNFSHLGDTLSGGAIGFAFEDEYELVEQKPAGGSSENPNNHAEWGEEDEGMLNCIIATLCEESHGGREANHKMVTWLGNRLKSLRPKPKAEWTIKDAKPGDILTTDTVTFIFKSVDKNGFVSVYCSYGVSTTGTNLNLSNTTSIDSKYVHPASIEQRQECLEELLRAIQNLG